MKYCLLMLTLFMTPCLASSQEGEVDQAAIAVLDRMSAVIGDMTSCSFTLKVAKDIAENSFRVPMTGVGSLKSYNINEVYFSGPDKMLIKRRGDEGHQGMWYSNSQLAWYSFDEHNYIAVEAPDRTVDMMYALNEQYGIDFPAADFFNPYLTDDMIEMFDQIRFVGRKHVDGVPAYQVVATNDHMTVQVWISQSATNLPLKMVILYKEDDNRQYEATFEDWSINPDLPDAMFDFNPPPGANKVSIASQIQDKETSN